MPWCGGNMVSNLIDSKLLENHKVEIKSYFETWLSLQIPRRIRQMDDSEVHINAFMVNTWLNNNNCEITQKSGRIIHPQEKATLMINLTGNGIRIFVEQWEVCNKILEENKTDLSNDIDVVNKYAAILGIDIVREWWQKEGQKAYKEDLFSLMRK